MRKAKRLRIRPLIPTIKIKECSLNKNEFPGWHGTTIVGVKKDGKVVIAGDGQVSLGQTNTVGVASASKSQEASNHRPPLVPWRSST